MTNAHTEAGIQHMPRCKRVLHQALIEPSLHCSRLSQVLSGEICLTSDLHRGRAKSIKNAQPGPEPGVQHSLRCICNTLICHQALARCSLQDSSLSSTHPGCSDNV